MTARPLLSAGTGVPVTDPRRTEAGSTVAGEGVLMLTEHEHQGPTSAPGHPRQVAVVGAGTVGLATAWFQQEAGVQVTRPLLSAAASRRVFVAGGHGMWDVALGPATGQLLAQSVLEGEAPRSWGPSTRCAERPPPYARPKELLRAARPRP